MYKLTDKRLGVAEPILEKHRAALASTGSFDAHSFEHELRKALGLGYREVKDIIRDIYKKQPKYRRVAAYYMQHGNAPGPVNEFKPLLAELYGLKKYDSPEREEKQNKYWGR